LQHNVDNPKIIQIMVDVTNPLRFFKKRRS